MPAIGTTRRRPRPAPARLGAEPLEPRRLMTADFADAIGSALVSSGSMSVSGVIGDGPRGGRDVDLLGFRVAAGGRLTADVDARSLLGGSTLDSYLRVFDGSGRMLAFNDDFGSSLDSYLSISVPATDTYYVGVSGFGNSGYDPRWAGSGQFGSTGRYVLTVNVVNPTAPDSAGDTLATARNIGNLAGTQTFSDSIGGGDPNDFYRFTVTAASRLDFRLDGLGSDADLGLLDAAGRTIAASAAAGTTPDVIRQDVAAGVYYARVYPFSGGTNYRLTLAATPLVPPMPGPNPLPPAPTPPAPPVGPPLPTPVYRSTTGWGLADASAAVARLRGQTTAYVNVPDLGGNAWSTDMVNAPEVWGQGYTGSGVIVAVVDTGVDYNHPTLRQTIWVNPREVAGDRRDNDRNGFADDVRGWDFVDNDATPMDVTDHRIINGYQGNIGHGTHVAGSILAVAPDVQIMPVRVLNQRGSGGDRNIARGIRYAANNGAHVINLSLGGGYSRDIESAIRHAVTRGSVVVVAAGNDGLSSPGNPARLAARIDGVISVGAVDRTGSLAGFSHRAGADSRMQHVVAPGVNIHSTLPGGRFGLMSGTSMAAPHVAGVVALLRSALPTASPQRFWAQVTGTARQPQTTAVVRSAPTTVVSLGQMRALAFAVAAMPEAVAAAGVAAPAPARLRFAALVARG